MSPAAVDVTALNTAVSKSPSDGTSYVDAFLTMPTSKLDSGYTGAWSSGNTIFTITLTSPPTDYSSPTVGNDYAIACKAGVNVLLDLATSANPPTSARCCETTDSSCTSVTS